MRNGIAPHNDEPPVTLSASSKFATAKKMMIFFLLALNVCKWCYYSSNSIYHQGITEDNTKSIEESLQTKTNTTKEIRNMMQPLTNAKTRNTSIPNNDATVRSTTTDHMETDRPAGGERKPTLFIHVGPGKTGTSSIQCNLQTNPFLKSSNYSYLGRLERNETCPTTTNMHPLVRPAGDFINVQALVFQYILRGWFSQDLFQDYVINFKSRMMKLFEDGAHSILVAEEFVALTTDNMSDTLWELFAGFLDIQQDVTFLVTYRDYFDWTVSVFTFGLTYLFEKKFKTFLRPQTPSILDMDVQQMHFSTDVMKGSPYKVWSTLRSKVASNNIGDVSVFNYHDGGEDLPTRFVCSLPNTKTACNGSKNYTLERARVTDLDLLHADQIAMAAWKADLYFNKTAIVNDRVKVNRIIQHYVKYNLGKSFLELPLECMGEAELKAIFELSIEHAKEMLGDDFSSEPIKHRFQEKIAKKRFCSVNATVVVEDPEWQIFLKNETILGWDWSNHENKQIH